MRKKIVVAILLWLCLITSGFGQETGRWTKDGDSYWINRDSQEALLQAISCYEKALDTSPHDEVLLVRLTRAYYWKGMNMPETEKDARMKAFQQGMAYGETLFETAPKNIAGNFWYASNMARYGGERGVLKSLSFLSELKQRMNIVMETEPDFFYGGAYRFFAKLSESVPGLLRKSLTGYSLEEVEQLLKTSIEIEKNFGMTHLFLGDIYRVTGRKDLARKEYEIVLQIPEDAILGCAAEIRRDKKNAEASLRKYFVGSKK